MPFPFHILWLDRVQTLSAKMSRKSIACWTTVENKVGNILLSPQLIRLSPSMKPWKTSQACLCLFPLQTMIQASVAKGPPSQPWSPSASSLSDGE